MLEQAVDGDVDRMRENFSSVIRYGKRALGLLQFAYVTLSVGSPRRYRRYLLLNFIWSTCAYCYDLSTTSLVDHRQSASRDVSATMSCSDTNAVHSGRGIDRKEYCWQLCFWSVRLAMLCASKVPLRSSGRTSSRFVDPARSSHGHQRNSVLRSYARQRMPPGAA